MNTIEDIRAELRTLVDEVDASCRSQRRRMLFTWIVGPTALGVCAFFLIHTAVQIVQLDPPTVAAIGRVQIETRLPEIRALARERLVTEGPGIVSGILDSAVDGLGAARAEVEQRLTAELDRVAGEIAENVTALINERVTMAGEVVNERHPHVEGVMKLRALTDQVTADFSEVFAAALDEIVPEFARETDRVESYLKQLNDDSSMHSLRAQRERELIEILVCMVLRERSS